MIFFADFSRPSFYVCNKSHKYCTLKGLQRIFKIHDNSILFFLIQRKKDTFDIKCWHALLWNPVSKRTWKMALNAQIKSKTLARSLLRCFFSKLDSEEFFYFLKKVHVFHFEWCAFVQVCWYIFFLPYIQQTLDRSRPCRNKIQRIWMSTNWNRFN